MASLTGLLRGVRRQRWRRILLFLAAAPVAAYLIAVLATFHPKYETLPAETWQSGVVGVAVMTDPQYAPKLDSLAAAVAVADAEPPARLTSAAQRWVSYVNRTNPEAILYHEVDALGNLYVVFGAWWVVLEPDHQLTALDTWGAHWRSYLHDAVGQWDPSEGFSPGIVVLDTKGRVAHNINGEVAILRQPEF